MDGRVLLGMLMSAKGLNPNSLAKALDNATSQPQIHKFVSGVSKEPKRSTLQPVADYFGVPLDAFFSFEEGQKVALAHGFINSVREDDPPVYFSRSKPRPVPVDPISLGLTAIRRVEFKISAGVSGFTVEYLDNGEGKPLFYSKDWYEKNGFDPERLYAIKVTGESMEPTYFADYTVVVNTAVTDPKDGLPFAVNYEGEVVIKRMLRDAGNWWLSSDNPDQRRYPRKLCDENTHIIGEVVEFMGKAR